MASAIEKRVRISSKDIRSELDYISKYINDQILHNYSGMGKSHSLKGIIVGMDRIEKNLDRAHRRSHNR